VGNVGEVRCSLLTWSKDASLLKAKFPGFFLGAIAKPNHRPKITYSSFET